VLPRIEIFREKNYKKEKKSLLFKEKLRKIYLNLLFFFKNSQKPNLIFLFLIMYTVITNVNFKVTNVNNENV
jgi:hypothetical protein